ncbi:AraC family transcriptional regulator [Pluralibacter gergoviae]|uniref:helix-turn-helix domain-containing protein n=1 Tax=Pluralibacter gergoviae TaxID=61647 RepID=UPI0005ECDA1E|nr:helix-turn-helix domain-containing protein [Pluralibacter gergoviae]KJM66008.1 AraC family transcriptional regulator [Pluralibacter gergoviae]OUQ96913.1 AraC family transcriptional regulator [Pluralibacter gergoviae]
MPCVIPVFKLYGEPHDWPGAELLHCESIHSRSSLYAWTINVHQHADLVQLLYVEKGEAEIEIEGKISPLTGPFLQVIPALCAHGFRFSPGTKGFSLTLAAPLIMQIEQQFGRPLTALRQSQCLARGEYAASGLFSELCDEYQEDRPARAMMVHAKLCSLLAWAERQLADEEAEPPPLARKHRIMRRFNQLIESHYREHLSVARYANLLGMSTVHLNTLCHEFHGCSALNVIHQRLLLEARRSLRYTSMSIAQISDYLGFSDATYFSRFFRRACGSPPRAWRAD